MKPVLSVSGLSVRQRAHPDRPALVEDVGFSVAEGETLALIGESGSGKSLTIGAVLGLLPTGLLASGSVELEGTELLQLRGRAWTAIRGARVALIPQDPTAALNPLRSIGSQLVEAIKAHRRTSTAAARLEAANLLELVDIENGGARLGDFPHQFSGGMRQRVLIAMAIAHRPSLLLADEPMTALDPHLQLEIVALLSRLQAEFGTALVLVTHDVGLVEGVAKDVVVLYAGQVVEAGPVEEVLGAPSHGYTHGLMAAVPRLDRPGRWAPAIPGDAADARARESAGCPFAPRCRFVATQCTTAPTPIQRLDRGILSRCTRHAEVAATPPASVVHQVARRIPTSGHSLLAIDDLSVAVRRRTRLGRGGGIVTLLKGLSLDIGAHETVALLGRSGSGKTTLANAIVGLQAIASGSIRVDSHEITGSDRSQLGPLRAATAVLLQDAGGSLNPRMTVGRALAEPFLIHRRTVRPAGELLSEVGLGAELASRFPHQLSGGQRQRVALARALACSPTLLISDEPTASLDASVRSQVLALLARLQDRHGFAHLLITHDVRAAAALAGRVLVLLDGRIVERGTAEDVLSRPSHPYTVQLLGRATASRATPRPPSEAADSLDRPDACAYRVSCPVYAMASPTARAGCDQPPWRHVSEDHEVACEHPIVPEVGVGVRLSSKSSEEPA